jgi:hypothetical protein
VESREEVKRVVALADGPSDEAVAFAEAWWCHQYGAPHDGPPRRDEIALAYEAGQLHGLEVQL